MALPIAANGACVFFYISFRYWHQRGRKDGCLMTTRVIELKHWGRLLSYASGAS